jgi:predicted SprT family Zn-dependent metalloprotease
MLKSQVTALARQIFKDNKLHSWNLGFLRSKRILGFCNYSKKTISLSIYFCCLNDEAAVRQLLLHEVAHALATSIYGSPQGHNSNWKQICRQLGTPPKATITLGPTPLFI